MTSQALPGIAPEHKAKESPLFTFRKCQVRLYMSNTGPHLCENSLAFPSSVSRTSQRCCLHSLYCLLDLRLFLSAHISWSKKGAFSSQTEYRATCRPAFIFPAHPPLQQNWFLVANFIFAKWKTDYKNISRCKWEKEKTSVKLIKGKYSFDLLSVSVLSTKVGCCSLLGGHFSFMLETNSRGLSALVWDQHTTNFNIHLAVFLLFLHLGNIFFYFCPLSQLWHSCH